MWRTRRSLTVLVLSLAAAGCPSPASKPTTPGERPAPPRASVWQELEHASPAVRQKAVERLARDGSERAVAALVARLGDDHADVRGAAERALLGQGKVGLAAVAKAAFEPGAEAVRLHAGAALVKAGEDAIPLLVTEAEGKDAARRTRAGDLLAQLGPTASPALVLLLRHPQVEVGRLAAEVLAKLPGVAAVEPLLQALYHPDEKIQAAAVNGLRARRDPAVIARLLTALGTWDPHRLNALLWVLHDAGDPQVTQAIARKFGESASTFDYHLLLSYLVALDPAWYGRVAAGLASPDPKVKKGVLAAFQYELLSLERIRTAAIAYDDGALRQWATREQLRAQEAVKQDQVVQALQALLKDPGEDTRYGAARTLAAAGVKVDLKKAERELQQALERRAAAIAKGKATPPGGREELVILYTRIGDLLWQQSCTGPALNGLCATMKVEKVPGQARPQRLPQYLPRNAALAKRAKALFDQALAVWKDGAVLSEIPADAPNRIPRVARAKHYAAWALFMQAEVGLEQHLKVGGKLQLKNPGKGDAGFKAAVEQLKAQANARFTASLQQIDGYTGVILGTKGGAAGKVAKGARYWQAAAMARSAQVQEHLGRELHALAVRTLATAFKGRTDIVAQVDSFAGFLARGAAEAYGRCLGSSSQMARFWEWALICEWGMARTAPALYEKWRRTNPWRGFRAPQPSVGP